MNIFVSSQAFAKIVHYELVAKNISVNISGKKNVDFAISINGGIPAPTLEFIEGDEAEIIVKNEVPNEELSIHWHGILLPPEMDGVPYVNTPPIPTGKSHTFKFKIRQHGTFWYHSHTATQEQKGVYGAFIIHPIKQKIAADKEAVLVLSDWTDENPDQVLKNLRKDGEFYRYKKGTVRSYLGALKNGSLRNLLTNEWSRMGSMDLSDVGYDAFLINGKKDGQLLEAQPGEKVRLRIINASASTYFFISLAGLPMNVISADGTDIAPILAKEIFIGMAETYDVLFTAPEHKNYELRATSQDVTGFASAWIGMGEKVNALDKSKPDLYASMKMTGAHNMSSMSGMDMSDGEDMNSMPGMDMSDKKDKKNKKDKKSLPKMDISKKKDKTSMHGMDMADDDMISMPGMKMDHSNMPAKDKLVPKKSVNTLSVDQLKSPVNTELPKSEKIRELKFVLGGDMERYIWFINGETIAEDYKVTIEEGEIVRMTFVNDTMMNHPFHLHGHFFRVINDEGKFSPMKHTVDIPPMGSRTIEFYANEKGDWMLHCHNLYHLKTGMARVVSYASFIPSPEIKNLQKQDPHLHDHIYHDGRLELSTNHAQADLRLQRTWDAIELRVESRKYNPVESIEGDVLYRHFFSRFLSATVGATYYDEFSKTPTRAVLGVSYLLPLLINSDLFIDHKGKFRLDLEKRFQWTKYIFSDFDITFRQDTKAEFEASLMYANAWSWDVGLMFTENSAGLGIEYKF